MNTIVFSVNNNAKKLEDMEEDYTKQKSEQHVEEPPYCEIPVEIRKEVWYEFLFCIHLKLTMNVFSA